MTVDDKMCFFDSMIANALKEAGARKVKPVWI